MAPDDPIGYYNLVATILLGVVLAAVVQLRDIGRSTRRDGYTLVPMLSFLALGLVLLAAVATLAEIPGAARGEATLLTFRRAEWIATALLGLSVASVILVEIVAVFRRRPTVREPEPLHASPPDSSAPRHPKLWWLLAVLILLAIGRCGP